MNNNSPMNNELVKLNDCFQNENNLVMIGVTEEGQWLSKKDESHVNEDMENGSDKQTVTVQLSSQVGQQRSQQRSREPLFRWERFMPLPSLKVLLVEYDDSTRHVVSALLRNCGYEVTAVANGLQAWKILEDLTTHVDLVLTELIMPHMSGISLLSKIMIHTTFKNIPVIMMSSHDSVSIVFKCLSEGAADFLVKPIRKNELKNLWQHVWRKCQNSSSGSGCENSTQTKKCTRLKSAEKSGNNTGSNDEDCTGIYLHTVDGSENGSDTQSSFTKRAVETDSPKISAVDQLADIPDNTYDQVILSRPEAFNVNWAPTIAAKEHGMQEFELDTVDMGKELEIGVPSFPTLQVKDPGERGLAKKAITNSELKNEKANGEFKIQVVNIISGVTPSRSGHHIESISFSTPNGTAKVADKKDKATHDKKERPSLEFSLKTLRDDRDTKTSCDKNVLRCSNLSAFSRYFSASTTDQTPTGNVGSCSPPDDSSEAAKTEMQDFQSNSNSKSPKQLSNGSSNNYDMGSTTNNAFTKQVASGDEAAPKSLVKCHPNSFAFHLGLDGPVPFTEPTAQDKTNAPTAKAMLTQAKDINSQIQVEHHHHHYHHHHHHVHKMPKHQLLQNHEEVSLENIDVAALQHGELSMLSAPQEDNAYNHSLNGSASGSNHRSNGQGEGTSALNAAETKVGSDDGIAKIGGIIDESGNGSRAGVGQNFLTQREVALNKFRQKRKERCFEKKVRYQSRQKLAEQRPRVRGQFVRQVVHENKGKDAPC